MKKIMILGAGRGQVQLIKTAKKLGYYTIVASIEGNYPGFDIADEKCCVDISNPEAVLEQAQKLKIDGIATSCLDTGIAALGYVCEKMNLPGLDTNAAKSSNNKLLMKEALAKYNVSTARYKLIHSEEELLNSIDEFTFPIIIKAVDLQGSRGINIIRTKEKLLDGYRDTMSETGKDVCLVEEFIEGYDLSVNSFVVNEKCLFILLCGDITYIAKTGIPVGHYVLANKNDDLLRQAEEESKKAIKALGLNNCAVNIDFVVRNNKLYVIELTGRIGANCLPELTSIYYGVDIYKMIVETAMGIDVSAYFIENKKEPTPCYAKMLISEESGSLKEIINSNEENDNIYEITYFVEPGDKINKFTNSKDCIGQVIVKEDTLDNCEKFIGEVIDNIKFVLE